MVETQCWISYKEDRALEKRIKEGAFADAKGSISRFPPVLNNRYWTTTIEEWASTRGLTVEQVGDETVSVRVKKDQILDFINYVYGNDSSYNDPSDMLAWKGSAYLVHQLLDLRVIVAQELNPDIWYELMADTF